MPLTLSPGTKGLSAALEKSIASQGKSYRSLPGVVGGGGDLPGGPVVKKLPSNAGGSTSTPGWGTKIATTTEPAGLN